MLPAKRRRVSVAEPEPFNIVSFARVWDNLQEQGTVSPIGRNSDKHAFTVHGSHTKETIAYPSTHCLTACNASCGLEVRAQDSPFWFGEVVRAEDHAYVSIQRHWLALYMDTSLF